MRKGRFWAVAAAVLIGLAAEVGPPIGAQALTLGVAVVPCGDVAGLAQALERPTVGVVVLNATLSKGCTYSLTTAYAPGTGLPEVDHAVVVHGNGATVAPAPGYLLRDFLVGATGRVELHDLTVSGGDGGILNRGSLTLVRVTVTQNPGGGIANAGRLELVASVISDNLSSSGGGIDNSGTLVATASKIDGNFAAFSFCCASGGGLLNEPGATARLVGGEVSGNGVVGDGAGIYNAAGATVVLVQVRLVDNRMGLCSRGVYGNGGGMLNQGKAILVGAVIEGNISVCRVPSTGQLLSNGGGIDNLGQLALIGGIVIDNAAGSGGGIYNSATAIAAGSVFLKNSPDNCAPSSSVPGCL